jgi:hypothetical protein
MGNLNVVLGGIETCAYGADHLAIHDNWQSALHGGKSRRDGCYAPMIDRLL